MIYTGFFDAAFDEETGTYDREYDSADFTGYFEQIVGSGICVYSNDDSMKVYYDSASQRAVVNPGYLFIRGYWLKNDGLYTVSLEGLSEGTYAIRAVLSMSARAISIGQVEKADPEEYPDSLVLAYVTIDANNSVTVEDTRERTDICGLIDAAGSLSQKVAYAINYINNEIDAKLNQIKEDLQAQEAIIDGKIEEANSLIAKIEPPAVGTIKFSASQDVGEDWLRCDGRFVNEVDYPELVAALGKNYPSGDKFQIISEGQIGTTISNGVLYNGYLWIFSLSEHKLYGISVPDGGNIKTIVCTSSHSAWSNFIFPTLEKPLCLSIVPHTSKTGASIFLSQIISSGEKIQGYATSIVEDYTYLSYMPIFYSEFDYNTGSLKFEPPFSNFELGEQHPSMGSVGYDYFVTDQRLAPYISSINEDGEEKYLCVCGRKLNTTSGSSVSYRADVIYWKMGELANSDYTYRSISLEMKGGLSRKNKGESVVMDYSSGSAFSLGSYPNNIFSSSGSKASGSLRSGTGPMCIAGYDKTLGGYDLDVIGWVSQEQDISKIVQNPFPNLPSGSKIFFDAGQYAWGKDMYFIFVGTGLIFSRTLEAGDYGFLDTTNTLGLITQFGYVDYDEEKGILYIVGQDTQNKVKVAKIILNTLYDYANDGAWLPMIASDGIPAYIKAMGEPPAPEPPPPTEWPTVTVKNLQDSGLPALTSVFQVLLNDETLVGGTNMEYPVTSILKLVALQDYTNPESTELDFRIYLGGKSATTVDAVVSNSVPLLGKVLSRGGSVTRGEEVQVSLNMENLQSSGYSTFWFITKSAQGS